MYDEAKYLYPFHFYERSPSYKSVDPNSKPGSVGDAGGKEPSWVSMCLLYYPGPATATSGDTIVTTSLADFAMGQSGYVTNRSCTRYTFSVSVCECNRGK